MLGDDLGEEMGRNGQDSVEKEEENRVEWREKEEEA